MRLNAEQQVLKDKFLEERKAEMVKKLVDGLGVLDDLFEQRSSIHESVSNLKQQIKSLDDEIQKLSEENENREREDLETLTAGELPKYSDKMRENRAKIDDLRKWHEQVSGKLSERKKSLDPVENQIARKWHQVITGIRPEFKEQIDITFLMVEAMIEAWHAAIRECEKSYKIKPDTLISVPPALRPPFSKIIQEKMLGFNSGRATFKLKKEEETESGLS